MNDAAAPSAPLPNPGRRVNVGSPGVDTRAAPATQHEGQMTPTREPPDRSEELHGALLQLLLNTSGDDFDSERVLVDSLQHLSRACRPIKSELGQPAPEQGQHDAPELVELRRQFAGAQARAGTAEALVVELERRVEEAERERDEFEENAARTLEEELAQAADTAAAALEEVNLTNRKAMEGMERAHQMQLDELRQQSQRDREGCEAASAEFEREAASAERERKLAEFRATKLEEQRALENQADQQNTSRLVQEAEQLAELAEQRAAHAESRQKHVEARLACVQEDKLDAEERWRASINEADELRAQLRALKFEHEQIELAGLGATACGGGARRVLRGQAMRFERQLAEAEQRASIEKQRAQGWERRHERMVAELRASAAKLTQRNELVSQLQMELRQANVQAKELLDITNGSTPCGGVSGTSGRSSAERASAMPQKTGLSWRQLALQVESMAPQHAGDVASSTPEAVLLSNSSELSMEEALHTAKRQAAQLRGELDGEREAKHNLEDELAKRNREYEQLKLELPELQKKFLELSNAEKASLDELAEAEERAISAQEEVVRRQQLLQILANEVDGILAAADGDAAQHQAGLMVSWDSIRRMRETILSANLGPRQGLDSLVRGGTSAPADQLQRGIASHLQSADLWPPRGTPAQLDPGATAGYGLTQNQGDSGFQGGRANGMALPQPYSAQSQPLRPATTTALLPPWQPRLDISTPGLSGISTSSAGISSSRLGPELGAGQRSTSAQAEKFRARLEMTGSVSKQNLPKRSPSADSLLTSRPAKPRSSMMEAVKAGLGGATDGVVGANRSATLPTSSRSSSDADEMTLKVQAALQSAKAAAVGDSDEIRSGTDTGSVVKRLPENAKEEAIRQRVKEQLKQAQEEAAAGAGT